MTSAPRVVVTRSSDDADTLARALEEIGAEVIRLPTIAIEFPDDLDAAADAAIAALRDCDWVLFSSRPGVTALRLSLERRDIAPGEALASVRIGAVGAATVAAIERDLQRNVDLVPERFTGADLVRALGEGTGRVLLPRPEGAPRSVVDDLSAAGWGVVEVPLYRTVRGKPAADAIARVRDRDFDVLTFTSGSTVRFFVEIVGAIDLEGRRVVVIGPSTEAVAREVGFHVDAVADPHTTEGVVAAVSGVVGR